VTLTYFEFTTLAILSLMAASGLDLAILEVGLGGRLDAVNVIDTDCAIVTSIDLDHMDYLGPGPREHRPREGRHPARGQAGDRQRPMPPHSVIQYATRSGADLWLLGRDFNFSGDKQQWAWAGRGRRYPGLAYPALRGANQLLNASGVLAALEALRPRPAGDGAGDPQRLAMVELPGRFQIVPGQPTLVLDVAHNPHSVAAAGGQPRRDGLLPDHARGVRRHGRQGPGADAGEDGAAGWTAGTSRTCRRRGRASARALRSAGRPRRGGATCPRAPTRAPRMPCAPPRPLPSPLIESSCSDRSTRWAACSRMACLPLLQTSGLIRPFPMPLFKLRKEGRRTEEAAPSPPKASK
jgi:hypothetical protein